MQRQALSRMVDLLTGALERLGRGPGDLDDASEALVIARFSMRRDDLSEPSGQPTLRFDW
jgi:hypothetical protein